MASDSRTIEAILRLNLEGVAQAGKELGETADASAKVEAELVALQGAAGQLAKEFEAAKEAGGKIDPTLKGVKRELDKLIAQKAAEKLRTDFKKAAESAADLNEELETVGKQLEANQKRSVLQAFESGDQFRDRVTRGASVFGDVGTSVRTLGGAGNVLGAFGDNTEQELIKVAEAFDAVEGGARLAADSSALVSKTLAAFPGLIGPTGIALAAFTAIAAGAVALFSQTGKATEEWLASFKKIEIEVLEPQRLIAEQTVASLKELQDLQESQVEQLELQRQSLERALSAQDGFREGLQGIFTESNADKIRDELARVNEELKQASSNLSTISSTQVQSGIEQQDFIVALEDELDRKRFIADLQENADNASIDRKIRDIEFQRELNALALKSLETKREEQRIEDEARLAPERQGGVEKVLKDFDEYFEKLNDAEREILAQSQSYEEFITNMREFDSVMAGVIENTDSYSVRIRNQLNETFEAAVPDTSALDNQIEERRAAEEELAFQYEIVTTLGREYAEVNESRAETETRLTEASRKAEQAEADRTRAIEQTTADLEKTVQEIGSLEADRSLDLARRAEDDALAARKDAALATADRQIQRAQEAAKEEQHQQKIQQIRDDGNKAVEDLEKRHSNALVDLENDFSQQQKELFRDYGRAEIEANRELQNQIEDDNTDHQRRLRDILKESGRKLEDAFFENNVTAFIQAQEEADRQIEDANQAVNDRSADRAAEFVRERQERRQQFEQSIADNRQAFNERRAELRTQQQQEVQDLITANNAKVQAQQAAYTQELTAQEKQLKRLQLQRQNLEERFAAQEQNLRLSRERLDYQARVTALKQYRAELTNVLRQQRFLQAQPTSGRGGVQIPILDSGGIVSSPTLAALAQNNRPEAVIPLGSRQAGQFGMGGRSVTVNLGGVQVGEIVSPAQLNSVLDELADAIIEAVGQSEEVA